MKAKVPKNFTRWSHVKFNIGAERAVAAADHTMPAVAMVVVGAATGTRASAACLLDCMRNAGGTARLRRAPHRPTARSSWHRITHHPPTQLTHHASVVR